MAITNAKLRKTQVPVGAPAIAIVAALALAVELFDKKDGRLIVLHGRFCLISYRGILERGTHKVYRLSS